MSPISVSWALYVTSPTDVRMLRIRVDDPAAPTAAPLDDDFDLFLQCNGTGASPWLSFQLDNVDPAPTTVKLNGIVNNEWLYDATDKILRLPFKSGTFEWWIDRP